MAASFPYKSITIKEHGHTFTVGEGYVKEIGIGAASLPGFFLVSITFEDGGSIRYFAPGHLLFIELGDPIEAPQVEAVRAPLVIPSSNRQ